MSNSASLFIDIISAPKKALANLQEKPGFIFPFIVISAAFSLMFIYYFAVVDFAWLLDQMVISQHKLSVDEQNQMREGLSMMNPTIMTVTTVIGSILTFAFIYLMYSIYILLISKITNDNIEFKGALSLVCWTGIPAVFSVLASCANIFLASNGKLALDAINPLTLNALIFNLPYDSPFKTIASSIDITQLWGLALLVLGYGIWTQKPLGRAALTVLPPYFVIFGIWLVVAML